MNCPCTLTVAADTVLEDGVLFVRIHIEDDGVGFDTQLLDEHGQVGLANTRERLQLCFPDSLFRLESAVGVGTSIFIMIPEAHFHENYYSG
ncbi:sensor histidine kinase [Paenibacillus sp. FSL H7-0331]|uniref:sensor histidine kinase n=1 Tax=Paenibacillus sp. FSL H7-0331 TaxID=1920421 RepID=UPI002116564C|nr:hypothetical protein [Paenibacillus sp. FSL H7-0331]